MAIKLILGDALTELRKLPGESVHCCVTSPPYWNLRDYGTASWAGGDPACDHRQAARKPADWSTSGLQRNKKTPELSAGTMALVNHQQEPHYTHLCGKCGAIRTDKQIGLEATPEAYVAVIVEVFREVRRVLRSDGTLWLNLGDSYAAGKAGRADTDSAFREGRTSAGPIIQRSAPSGFKPKDLIGIPWRVAFALQAAGWYLRQDIIWSKPNPMPESVTDRCTKAHEYLFLLSKSSRYHYDADAIREVTGSEMSPEEYAAKTAPGATWKSGRAIGEERDTGQVLQQNGGAHKTDGGLSHPDGRNRRSVWTVATAPYSEAHFATFPPALIEPAILAGCPKGGVVLDPFSGAGTTGLVADRLQRSAILIELNGDYLKLANGRILDDGPLFADVTQAEADNP